MRAWLTLAVLALVVGGLGAWIYTKPPAPTRASHALSELKAQDVRRIRIERAAQGEAPASVAVLERIEDRWRLTEPYAARAEATQVDRLLAMLDAQSVARYPATELARYGLDQPAVTIVLNDEKFGLGAVNTNTREQYVLARGSVYAIPLVQRTAVPRDADALVSRALFAPGEEPVRFELPGFSASLEDGAWTFAPPGDDPGPDERNAWVGAWRQATAVQAARHDGRQAVDNVSVHLKDGRTVTFGVLQREPELVLLRTDEGIQYHFFADTAKRLLSQPGTATK